MLSDDAADGLTARQFRYVLDTVEECQEATSTEQFRMVAVERIQRFCGCRNITFFAGATFTDMFYDPAPVLIGDIAGLMDEWTERWRSADVFSSDAARRFLLDDGFASLDRLGHLSRSQRSYAEGYLRPHRLSDASAILLRFTDGNAIIGMFDTDRARSGSEELAVRLLARHLGYSSRHRRVLSPGAPPPSLSGLTDRQREVAQLVSQGLSNREIADRLFLTEGAVKKHLSRIFEKSRLTNRASLAAAVLTEPSHGPAAQ